MELERVAEFLQIAEFLSIKMAAVERKVSGATLAARLAVFEKSLNVVLFDRSHNPLMLTEAGKTFLPEAEEVMRLWGEICEAVGVAEAACAQAQGDGSAGERGPANAGGAAAMLAAATAVADTDKLYEFVLLSRTLNYSKAASALFLSQSVLSKHVKELEKGFGQALLVRSTHEVALTPAGRALAARVPELLDQCDHAVALVSPAKQALRGTIRVACALELSYADHILHFLRRFKQRYRDLEVEMHVMSDGVGPHEVGKYDFILTPCEYVPLSKGIAFELIQTNALAVAVHSKSPLRDAQSLALFDLSGQTLLVPFANEPFGPYAKNWQIARKSGAADLTMRPCANLASALFEVATASGVCIVPQYVKHLLPKNVMLVPLTDTDCQFPEFFYYHADSQNEAALLLHKEYQKMLASAQSTDTTSAE